MNSPPHSKEREKKRTKKPPFSLLHSISQYLTRLNLSFQGKAVLSRKIWSNPPFICFTNEKAGFATEIPVKSTFHLGSPNPPSPHNYSGWRLLSERRGWRERRQERKRGGGQKRESRQKNLSGRGRAVVSHFSISR